MISTRTHGFAEHRLHRSNDGGAGGGVDEHGVLGGRAVRTWRSDRMDSRTGPRVSDSLHQRGRRHRLQGRSRRTSDDSHPHRRVPGQARSRGRRRSDHHGGGRGRDGKYQPAVDLARNIIDTQQQEIAPCATCSTRCNAGVSWAASAAHETRGASRGVCGAQRCEKGIENLTTSEPQVMLLCGIAPVHGGPSN